MRFIRNIWAFFGAVVLVLCLFCITESDTISVWKDVTLTQQEKYALDKVNSELLNL